MDCPDPENYAAIAKQLHATALDAEERIYCLEQQLRSAVNRPTFVMTTTGTMGNFGAVSNISNLLDSWSLFGGATPVTINFQNSDLTLRSPTVGFRPSPPAGIYHIGVYINPGAIGAQDNNSFRSIMITSATLNPLTGGLQFHDVAMRTTFCSTTATGDHLTLSTVMRFDGVRFPMFMFRHGNTSSSMNIAIGAIAWITRLSDDQVLRVL